MTICLDWGDFQQGAIWGAKKVYVLKSMSFVSLLGLDAIPRKPHPMVCETYQAVIGTDQKHPSFCSQPRGIKRLISLSLSEITKLN